MPVLPARSRLALTGAIACAGLAALVWLSAFHIGRLQWADGRILEGFMRLEQTRVERLAVLVASLADPAPFAVLTGLVLLQALWTLGPRGAAVLLGVIVVANVTTQFLKEATAAVRPMPDGSLPVVPASWPSGHSTAAAVLALCAVLAASQAWRPIVAAAGAAYAVGVATSVVILGWHLPSDALGGFAIAGCAACVGAWILSRTGTPRAPRAARRRDWRHGRG